MPARRLWRKAGRSQGELTANIRITSTRGIEAEFDLPPGWALAVDGDGREYVGVRMADDHHPVQVVYWSDEIGDDNVTVSPPGVLVPDRA